MCIRDSQEPEEPRSLTLLRFEVMRNLGQTQLGRSPLLEQVGSPLLGYGPVEFKELVVILLELPCEGDASLREQNRGFFGSKENSILSKRLTELREQIHQPVRFFVEVRDLGLDRLHELSIGLRVHLGEIERLQGRLQLGRLPPADR